LVFLTENFGGGGWISFVVGVSVSLKVRQISYFLLMNSCYGTVLVLADIIQKVKTNYSRIIASEDRKK